MRHKTQSDLLVSDDTYVLEQKGGITLWTTKTTASWEYQGNRKMSYEFKAFR